MRWRLLLHGPADGPYNMAVDEALLLAATAGNDAPATVRLYSFRSPTLTFGYGQSADAVASAEACRELGIDRVRRLTGGRALLHQHELTYSVSAPSRGIFSGLSVRAVYAAVSSALAGALDELGAPLDRALPVPPPHRAASAAEPLPCLAVPSAHEITARGRKIVASAQRRRRLGFLQHGAILRRVDRALWDRIAPLRSRATLDAVGLDELLEPPPSDEALVEALEASFSRLFGAPPTRTGLTRDESARASRLAPKYRSPGWTLSRCAPAC